MKNYCVVFDGTTAYVIPVHDLEDEIRDNEVELLADFDDFDEACEYEEKANAEISNNGNN